ncbi:hypothetical protein REPUB_Repub13aG0097900 [Reevesia pubescens]
MATRSTPSSRAFSLFVYLFKISTKAMIYRHDDVNNMEEIAASLLKDVESTEEMEKLAFISTCALDSVRAGGSVLVPIYIISSVAEELLAFTNIIPEWLCKQRQEKPFSGEPLFAHVKLMKESKIHVRLCKEKTTGIVYAMKKLQKSEMLCRGQVEHVKAERNLLAEVDREQGSIITCQMLQMLSSQLQRKHCFENFMLEPRLTQIIPPPCPAEQRLTGVSLIPPVTDCNIGAKSDLHLEALVQ